jgi:hypothetical protein
VDAGGGPDRDDYGLPPVDVEVPDDARELDPDVHAYRRELRAARRERRSARLRRPVTREGLALPLLAGCLMVALVSSTLLILFAAGETGMPRLPAAPATRSHPSVSIQPTSGKAGQPLPSAEIIVGGRSEPVQAVAAHAPSMLALIPRDCSCATTLRQLAVQADADHVPLYLIGTPGVMTQVAQLAAEAGQGPATVGEDVSDVLPKVYQQAGLTTLLVRTGGLVTYVARDLTQQALSPVAAALQQLSQPGTRG